MIGVIGYKNHSLKILNILIKLKFKKIIVYCSNKKKLLSKKNNVIYTEKINDLYQCNNIFIASPNKTHVKYIKKFLSEDRYVFCEKPAATSIKEIQELKKIKLNLKEKLYFNFNYLKSNAFKTLEKEIKNKTNGKLMHISVAASHGLFLKKEFKKNWRINSKNIFEEITGNLGIHYINLIYYFYGNLKLVNINRSKFSKKGKDTVLLTLQNYNQQTANIFMSYSTVYSQEIKIYFTNAILEISNEKIYKFSPRETFDEEGKFIKPKKKLIDKKGDISKYSLEESIKYFLKIAKTKTKFNIKDFNLALKSSLLLLKN